MRQYIYMPKDATYPVPQRPILRWAGSKRKLLPMLLAHVPLACTRYVEPFAGSACLLFALRPQSALIGDTNAELIEVYDILRNAPDTLYSTVISMPRTHQFYYRLRQQNPRLMADVDRAARFVYLNRFSFNGVYRTNTRGEFNVPRGSATGDLPSLQDFLECASILSKCVLHAGDFAETLAHASKGDFVYLDPPYSTSIRPMYGEYGYGSFSSKDFSRLVEEVRSVVERGATVLLSYSEDALSCEYFKDWQCCTLRVRRHVAGFAKHRAIVREVLMLSN
jgi:DNA adenine methylase